MGLFTNKYPYTDFHELNLDWILEEVKKLGTEYENFVAYNTIKFSDPIDWDITRLYDPNTIVLDSEIGNTYLSRKRVPAGVLLSNSEYWLLIGNYNAQIGEIQETLKKLPINGEVLKDRVFLVVGDSYAIEVNETKWPSTLKNMLGISNNNWFNFAVSGSGFMSDPSHTLWIDQINTPEALAVSDRITDMLIIGGLNDSVAGLSTNSSIENTLRANIEEFVTYARLHYPNATLHIGYAGNAADNSPTLNGRSFNERSYCKFVYQTECSKLNVQFINKLETSWPLNLSLMYSDHEHPSFLSGTDANTYGMGCWYLASAIASYLRGYTVNTCYPVLNVRYNGVTGSDIDFNCRYTDYDKLNLLIDDHDFIKFTANSITVESFSRLKLATNSTFYFNKPFKQACNVVIEVNNSNQHTANGMYIFDGYDLYFMLLEGKDNGGTGGWIAYNNVTGIYNAWNSFDIPLEILV